MCKSIKVILRFRWSKFSHYICVKWTFFRFSLSLSRFICSRFRHHKRPALIFPTLLLLSLQWTCKIKFAFFSPLWIKFFYWTLDKSWGRKENRRKQKEWKRNGNILQPSFIYSIKVKIEEQMECWSSPLKDIPDTLNENIMIKLAWDLIRNEI